MLMDMIIFGRCLRYSTILEKPFSSWYVPLLNLVPTKKTSTHTNQPTGLVAFAGGVSQAAMRTLRELPPRQSPQA